MSEAKLRPCPFCGWDLPRASRSLEHGEDFVWVVYCPGCGAEGPKKGCHHDNAQADAIEEWNSPFLGKDAEIARLKARVAELEQGDMFWNGVYTTTSNTPLEALQVFFSRWGFKTKPVRIPRATRLPYVWGVLVPGTNGGDTTAHTFPTEEEAEAFCEKMRAKKGAGA